MGRKRGNVIRDMTETWIEGSTTDEPEAADLAANDASEDDTATALPDVCLEDAIGFPRITEIPVSGNDSDNEEEQELTRRLNILRGTD